MVSLFIISSSFAALAKSDVYHSCMWTGEEYLRDIMYTSAGVSRRRRWVNVVYKLHQSESGSVEVDDFEGIGSCRFFLTSAGNTFESAKARALRDGKFESTHAYLRIWQEGVEFYIPEAESMGDGFMYYESDTNYEEPEDKCLRKKRKLTSRVKSGSASPIQYDDVDLRQNTHGGVSAVINANSPEKDYYGICHFH